MKRIFKDRSTAMVCGVCSGIAQYFNLDPTLIRLGWVLLSFLGGSGLLAYLICAIILPDKSSVDF